MKMETVQRHCDKHGDYEASITNVFGSIMESECPECLEEYDRWEEEGKQTASDAQAIERAKAMNLRPKYYKASFDNFDAYNDKLVKAKDAAQKIVKGDIDSILFVGPVGSGKTHLSAAALNAKRDGKYMTMYEVSATIRASYSPRAEKSELEIVNELASVPLLVIDEVGRTKGSDTELNWLSYIIDKRTASFLPSIILSNKHLSVDCEKYGCPDCVDNYFGEDIISRLQEHGSIIRFEGEDYRARN
jgi:DNA replication protein DnaC